jgi:hypothetical protein
MGQLMPRVQNGLKKRVRRASKYVYQAVRWRALHHPKLLLIVGCQRSGTTLVTALFDADRDCRVFREFSTLYSRDRGIRLNPLPDVAAIIDRVHAPLVVCKPLVETQRVGTLLNYFPGARALFMYRRYADVARSDLRKFGPRNAIDNIRPIAMGDSHNWRSIGASAAVRECIRRFYSESMNPQDAAALFWFARNSLYFDLNLPARADAMLCRYEHLVLDPLNVMRRIYEFVEIDCPDLAHTAHVHAGSVRKGSELQLLPEVRTLCEQLQARLDACYEAQSRVEAAPAVAAARTHMAQLAV